jgi:hypothetical protein
MPNYRRAFQWMLVLYSKSHNRRETLLIDKFKGEFGERD